MYNNTDSTSSEDIEEPEYIKKAEIKAVVAKPVYKKPVESAWTTVISKKKENKKKKKGRK